MVGEHSFLQAEMRREVLQLESMPSNKPQKPLIPLQIELWRYILRELIGKVSKSVSSVKSALVILVQGGNGIKEAKTHLLERSQDTKVKQSFNSPATCFFCLPAHIKTSSKSRLTLRPSFDQTMHLVFFLASDGCELHMCPFVLPLSNRTFHRKETKRRQQKSECRNRVLASKH